MKFSELGTSFIELGKKLNTPGEQYEEVKKEMNIIFPQLLTASKEENRYFSGAPLQVYKTYFNTILQKAKVEDIDFFYPSFIKKEYLTNKRYLDRFNPGQSNLLGGFYLGYLENENETIFRNIIHKRLSFLETEMYNNGIEILKQSDEFGGVSISFKENISRKAELKNAENSPELSLDLSDTKGTEKIIYLEKLGILNYLKELEPFRSSTNSLATVISAITGIPQTTVQPYLNPISNPTIDQKNNPLNSIKKVEKIEYTLNKLGFKPLP